MKKKMIGILLATTLLALLVSCSSQETTHENKEKTIIVGVTSGPFEKIANKVKEVAKKEGIHIKVVPFNDYIVPNQALDKGKIDVNVYQTIQFLNQYNKDRKTNIVPIGKVYTSSQGIYSKKYKKIEEIPDGATLGIPNDPINLWRGILIYQDAGLIKLKPGSENKATLQDIKENPKHFKLKELEAGMLAPTLNSLDASIIPSNYALQNGYNPKKDALFLEDNERFAIYVATNEKNKDNPDYKKLVELYSSDEVKKFIQENYEGVYKPVEDPFRN
ncbi:MetQ/NlpA family ABC transporter substrate-binding protein [Laceyella putida]|uniref:Lipoprotein n=1 Tax=Laceyella putida TaxID=110101 RepID=A0ABW2RM24_9BACL